MVVVVASTPTCSTQSNNHVSRYVCNFTPSIQCEPESERLRTPPTGSRGTAEPGFGEPALSTRESCTLTLRRDTLLSESATSDTTTLHASSESPVKFRTSDTVRFETPPIREVVEPALRSPRDQPLLQEHDALEHLATRLRTQAMLPPVLPIQSPILVRGPPSPIYTPPRTPPRARRHYGEYDPVSPITPLSPRPVRRRLTTGESTARGSGGRHSGRAVNPAQPQGRPRSASSSSLPPHCRLHPP